MITDRQLRQCSDSDTDSSPAVRQWDVRQWSDSGPIAPTAPTAPTARAQYWLMGRGDVA